MLIKSVLRQYCWRYGLSSSKLSSIATSKVPFSKSIRFRHQISDVETLLQETDRLDDDISASQTGVLDVKENEEVLLYYDHLYSLRFSNTRIKHLLDSFKTKFDSSNSDTDTQELVWEFSNSEKNPLPEGVGITNFVPLRRDGGAFVKFRVPQGVDPKLLIQTIKSNLKEGYRKEWRSFITYLLHNLWISTPACHSVKGTPWVEDLRRFPSPMIKINFEGESLTEEQLYVLFRRYGMILDISPSSGSSPHATIIYSGIRPATCAKNCITGLSLNNGKTVLHIQYLPLNRANHIKDFILNHQRIAIPLILALLAGAAVLIFDPIREWFIVGKINNRYSLQHYKNNRLISLIYHPFESVFHTVRSGYDYAREQVLGIEALCSGELADFKEDGNLFWSDRHEKAKQLKMWIYENIDTFIIVRGPQGAGKSEFVNLTLGDDPEIDHKLITIDCESLVKSRSDEALVKNAADQLGYFPIFTWTSSLSQFIDLGVQGMTGQKSGLSESKETQLKNILSLATSAIRKVALSDYKNYKKQLLSARKEKNSADVDSCDVSLPLKEDAYLQQHPEMKPVIVLNKFSSRSDNPNDVVCKLLAEWAAQLVQSNLAHVVFITEDFGNLKNLSDALPNQVFKSVALSDASHNNSKKYLATQLKAFENIEKSIDICLEPLGGRMLDLQAFIRRIKSGEQPEEALNEMISQASEQITTFFLSKSKMNEADGSWTTSQVWAIIKLLSKNRVVDYVDIIGNPFFKNADDTLNVLLALEKNDLISLYRDKGIISSITIGRPLFKAAFEALIDDPKIFKVHEMESLNSLISKESAKIKSLEEELAVIGDLKNLDGRLSYIHGKVESSNKNIMKYEKEISEYNNKKTDRKFLGIEY